MKHIDGLANSDSINGAVCIRVVTGDNLQYTWPDPLQRFCLRVFSAPLSKTQSFTNGSSGGLGKTADLIKRVPNPCYDSFCLVNRRYDCDFSFV